MEPDYPLTNIVILVAPFFCYYIGICIRKRVFPGKDSPPLLDQFLLGIPCSLLVVCPLLPVLRSAFGDFSALGVTLAVIMEHGMIVNETATSRIKRLAQQVSTRGLHSGKSDNE